jgi:hypothetical protein
LMHGVAVLPSRAAALEQRSRVSRSHWPPSGNGIGAKMPERARAHEELDDAPLWKRRGRIWCPLARVGQETVGGNRSGQVRAMMVEIDPSSHQLATVRRDLDGALNVASRAEAAFNAGNLDERSDVDLVAGRLTKEQEIGVFGITPNDEDPDKMRLWEAGNRGPSWLIAARPRFDPM